jgi:hypothetical protein
VRASTGPEAPESPYRTSARKSSDDRTRHFVYAPRSEAGGRDGLLTMLRFVWAPLTLAIAAAEFLGPTGGIAGLVGGAAYDLWIWRTRKKAGGALLSVDTGVLTVALQGPRARSTRFPLSELANVTLELKTIQRVVDGPSAIPAVRFIHSTVAPELHTARIVLVDTGGREVRLTEEYLPHFDATDWLGKIRVFLRKQGWVPEDERDLPEGQDEQE